MRSLGAKVAQIKCLHASMCYDPRRYDPEVKITCLASFQVGLVSGFGQISTARVAYHLQAIVFNLTRHAHTPVFSTLAAPGVLRRPRAALNPRPPTRLLVSGRGGRFPSFSKESLIQALNSAQNCGQNSSYTKLSVTRKRAEGTRGVPRRLLRPCKLQLTPAGRREPLGAAFLVILDGTGPLRPRFAFLSRPRQEAWLSLHRTNPLPLKASCRCNWRGL